MTTATKASSRRKRGAGAEPETPTAASLAAALPAALGVPLSDPPLVEFVKEANSPFPDGYSIAGEREVLRELLESDAPDENHPLYQRLLMLDDREQELRQQQSQWNSRLGAEPVVTAREAMSMRQLGSLVDESPDSMTLHTKEGFRLFMGRGRDPEGNYPQIVGGKRIASALKSLWTLTAVDNPYADWALVRHEQNLTLMNQRLDQETKAGVSELDAMKRRGLFYTVVMAPKPQALTLGFKSPYGYAIAELVVSYDYFIRVMKTLSRKNLKSDDQVRQSIREVTRFIRRHFNESARFERWLLRPELRELSRADFLPGAPAEASKRAEAATAIFGPVPAEVFSGQLMPRHSRRRQQLTDNERKLLQSVSADLARAEAATAGADTAQDEHVPGSHDLL